MTKFHPFSPNRHHDQICMELIHYAYLIVVCRIKIISYFLCRARDKEKERERKDYRDKEKKSSTKEKDANAKEPEAIVDNKESSQSPCNPGRDETKTSNDAKVELL